MPYKELPPILKGIPEQDLASIRDYLVRMAQDLDQVGTAKVVAEPTARTPFGKTPSGNIGATLADLQQQANLLRSLIIKTADDVTTVINGNIAENYVKSSEFGNYYQYIENQVENTIYGTTEHGTLSEFIQSVVGMETLQTFMSTVSGEIRRGFVWNDVAHQYEYGIAIAQNLQFYAEDALDPNDRPVIWTDGQKYYKVQGSQTFGLYTSHGWQFYINNNLVGWFESSNSDNALHVASAVIEDHVQIGDSWYLVKTTDSVNGETLAGIGFRYIGE